MATVKRHRKDRDGKDRWQVRYRDHNSKQRAKTLKKADAQRFAATVTADVLRGEYVDPDRGRVKLSQFATQWQTTRGHLSQATRDLDESLLQNHILPSFGGRSVSSIRQSELSAWISRLEVSSSTKSKCLQKLAAILELAKGDGAIRSNPADGVDRPRVKTREGRALSDGEIAKVIEAAETVDPTTAPLVWLMARAGLRIGEALALKRSDISGNMLLISSSMSRREGVRPAKGDSERTIPMPRDLAERLREHMAGSLVSMDGWVFTAPRGGRLRYDNWRTRTWTRITERADIGEIHPHDLRHTLATRLFTEDGWTVPAVQAYLGHSDPKVTLSIYTHVAAESLPEPSSAQKVQKQVN